MKKQRLYFTPFQWIALGTLFFMMCGVFTLGGILLWQNSSFSSPQVVMVTVLVTEVATPRASPVNVYPTFPPTWTPPPTRKAIPTNTPHPTSTKSGVVIHSLPTLESSDANYPLADPLDLKKRPHYYKGKYLSVPGYAFDVQEQPNGVTSFKMQALSDWNYEVFAVVVANGRIPELHENSLIAIQGTCLGYEYEFLNNGSDLPLLEIHYITVLN